MEFEKLKKINPFLLNRPFRKDIQKFLNWFSSPNLANCMLKIIQSFLVKKSLNNKYLSDHIENFSGNNRILHNINIVKNAGLKKKPYKSSLLDKQLKHQFK